MNSLFQELGENYNRYDAIAKKRLGRPKFWEIDAMLESSIPYLFVVDLVRDTRHHLKFRYWNG